jgi:hypothetical protein
VKDHERMSNRAVGCVAYSQVCFGFFIGVCVAIHPGLVLKWNEGGLSNFGIHIKTAIPYTLALGLASLLSHRGAVLLGRLAGTSHPFVRVLKVYSWLIAIVLVSTYAYSLNVVLKDFHIATGIAIALFELAASLWMYRYLGRSAPDTTLAGIQVIGFVLAALTFVGALHVLFLTQILTGVSFALLMVRSARRTAALATP